MLTLGYLVCGSSDESCTATATLDFLRDSIERFSSKALNYLSGPFSEEAQYFGAFATRVTLENACAALVGRLDSFRMLYLTGIQSQVAYEYGKPTKSGFKWTGDVFAEEKPGPLLWNVDQDVVKISRALFSAHFDAVYWRPAFNAAIDHIDILGVDGFNDLRGLEAENFISSAKGRCGPLYSTLSKGVHWDFFVSNVVIDEGTLKDTIRDTLSIISNLAFVSHFVPTSYHKIDKAQAVEAYRSFREIVK